MGRFSDLGGVFVPTPEQIAADVTYKRERQEKWARDLHRAQRDLLLELEMPPKDLALIQAGAVRPTPAIEALDPPITLLALSGPPGLGKTTAACVWLHRWTLDRRTWAESAFGNPTRRGSALFVRATKLARWPRYDDDEMDRLLGLTLLVVDDLGVEYLGSKPAHESFMTLFDEVVDFRYAWRRPTAFTTNLGPADFVQRYGQRVGDRFAESGRFVRLSGPSLRGQP
jgi:hypothetical protein